MIFDFRLPNAPHRNSASKFKNRNSQFARDGCRGADLSYIIGMNWLTKQEQMIICLVIGLLVTGLAVKYYRTAHPATTSSQPAKP
jgi:hypothetical protein